MIVLNSKKFARTKKEFTNSLFSSGGTCSGYYKPFRGKIRLFNPQHELIGVINKQAVLCSTSTINGTRYYHPWPPKIIGEYKSISQQFDECREALKKAAPKERHDGELAASLR